MKTLREFAQFVGNPNDPISPRSLLDYLKLGINPNPLSIRELIEVFDNAFDPVAIESVLVGPMSGIVPLLVGMQVTKTKGYTLEIRWQVLRNGQQIADYDGFRGQVAHTFSEAGTYTVKATVKGIGSNGYAEATKSVTVVAKAPTPTPTPTPTPVPTKPNISVSAKGDGSFVVNGSGFLPNTTVHIRVVDDVGTNIILDQSSTSQGTLNYTSGKLCQLPGRLYFSANDGRSDPSDLTGTLWSNTVTTTCS